MPRLLMTEVLPMKILFVSNLYPPHHRGGYEMLCQEVAEHLEARGHEVSVLTSTYGVGETQDAEGVYRRLQFESDVEYYRPQQVLRCRSIAQANCEAVQEVFAETAPDVVVVWGMWKLSRQIARRCEELAKSRVIYYLADTWPALPSAHEEYWDDATGDSLAGKVFKGALRLPVRWLLRQEWRPFRLGLEHVLVCSKSVREELVRAGLPLEHAQVVYHGIDLSPYREVARQRQPRAHNSPLRVVYVGGLLTHKGVHTAIEALHHLKEEVMPTPVQLTLLGAGHPEYEQHLHRLVEHWRLDGTVSFHQPIPRAELPAFLGQFDVLVMPSIYEEPQARISQEALAAGLILVATLTGGTRELLVDGQNGLAFKPEDAQGLAAQLRRLAQDPALLHRLAQAGRQTAAERFTITRMIDELESYMAKVAGKHG
jgi:glycogen(starch) synthase